LIIKRSPLSVPVKKPKATWVRPVIEYSGISDDGVLREAVLKGDDLHADDAPPAAPRRAQGRPKGRGGC
jgi:bifunctional non-homologous end joining protein LigD